MKKFLFPILFISFLLPIPLTSFSAAVNPQPFSESPSNNCDSEIFAPLSIPELLELDNQEVSQAINRKLSFKDKIILKKLRKHLKRKKELGLSLEECSLMEKKANNALIAGLIGLLFAGIILGAVAIANGRKAVSLAEKNPDCEEAAAAKKRGGNMIILGVIDIIGAILVILFIL
ncbi:MAG: hypothetical protein AAFY71_09085 [Bacteroidota bacterium]